MHFQRALGSSAVIWLCAASIAGAAEPDLGLADIVREALAANLDLAARERALAADREEISVVRSALLPQIGVGVQGQVLDDGRTDAVRGFSPKESATFSVQLKQALFDEADWAGFQIQKHLYGEQEKEYEEFRIRVIQDAAVAFVDLDRSRALVTLQGRNRDITLENLETSRARIAAGWSSETEVLRWQSQLAANESAIVGARVQALVDQFELNRVRDLPGERPVSTRGIRVDEYGFVYASDVIVKEIATPEGDRRLRDRMVLVGLERSPTLAAVDQAIAAAERQLTANRRAFYLPSVSLSAGVNHLISGRAGSDAPDFNDTEWTVAGGLTYPILEGGARFAELRQTSEALSSLRLERRAEAKTLSDSIRSTFAQASGAWAGLRFAREQEAAAQRYFELTNESYVLGVDSIIQLLDAQTQLLNAEIAVTNAYYGFFQALIAAEQELAYFPFLEPEAQVAELLSSIEQQLQVQP